MGGQLVQNRFDFLTRENHWNVALVLCPNCTIDLPEFLVEDVTKKEQQCIESLILSGCRNILSDRQKGQKFLHIVIVNETGRFASGKRLKVTNPQLVCLERLERVLPNLDWSSTVNYSKH